MNKKILLPTDFSKNALKAGKYAISVADLGDDVIILYFIDDDYLDLLK